MKDKAGGSRRSDGKCVLAWLDLSRLEIQDRGTNRTTFVVAIANGAGGPHAHEVLRLEPRFGPIGPDVDELEGPSRENR
jgi:hypothetical protein